LRLETVGVASLPTRTKLVMFDLYDTLVDLDVDYERIRKEVKELFVREDQRFASWSFRPIFKSIDEASSSSSVRKEDVISFINEQENASADSARPKSGAPELLSYLQLKGIHRGVFSRMNKIGLNRCLKAAGLSGFSIILGREDAKGFKPDPDQVILALDILGVSPGETVVVGDHPYDILSGKKAGAFAVGILTGEPSIEDLKNAGADLVLKDLNDLLELFRQHDEAAENN
jgi:phosphoglycolate phosphatase